MDRLSASTRSSRWYSAFEYPPCRLATTVAQSDWTKAARAELFGEHAAARMQARRRCRLGWAQPLAIHISLRFCQHRAVLAPASVLLLLNVGLTRTRVPTATPEDDRGEKAEPRRYALLTLIRHVVMLYPEAQRTIDFSKVPFPRSSSFPPFGWVGSLVLQIGLLCRCANVLCKHANP